MLSHANSLVVSWLVLRCKEATGPAYVIDPVWNHHIRTRATEVVGVRLDRRLRIDPALAVEIHEQFLLLCVDADHRQSSLQVLLPQAGDLLKLRVTIAMMAHGLLLLCLARAVAVLPKQLGHYVAAHRST